MNELQGIALEYLRAGLVPVPLRLDGNKAPAVAEWKQWQTSCPTPEHVAKLFNRPAGVGIICGAASHGLEVLDFDMAETFWPWVSEIPPRLFARLVVVETAGGGFHVLYRCSEIAGNYKIASWEDRAEDAIKAARRKDRGRAVYPVLAHECTRRPDKDVRIETRGEGGYIVAAGSPADVHPSRQPYVQTLGPPLPIVYAISPDERRTLWQAAATFDCRPKRSLKVEKAVSELKQKLWQQRQAERPEQDGLTPWDDFDQRGDWPGIIEPHGWTSYDGIHWTRPGKTGGISAKVSPNAEGLEILTVFSSNAGVLGEGAGAGGWAHWGKFRAFTALNYSGDSSEAGKALYAAGYGSRRSKAA